MNTEQKEKKMLHEVFNFIKFKKIERTFLKELIKSPIISSLVESKKALDVVNKICLNFKRTNDDKNLNECAFVFRMCLKSALNYLNYQSYNEYYYLHISQVMTDNPSLLIRQYELAQDYDNNILSLTIQTLTFCKTLIKRKNHLQAIKFLYIIENYHDINDKFGSEFKKIFIKFETLCAYAISKIFKKKRSNEISIVSKYIDLYTKFNLKLKKDVLLIKEKHREYQNCLIRALRNFPNLQEKMKKKLNKIYLDLFNFLNNKNGCRYTSETVNYLNLFKPYLTQLYFNLIMDLELYMNEDYVNMMICQENDDLIGIIQAVKNWHTITSNEI